MAERIEKLKGIVQQLEDELESLDTIDAQSERVLQDALDDLRNALGERDEASLASDSLAERLRSAEAEFQVSHPTVSGLVLRVIHTLGQFGV